MATEAEIRKALAPMKNRTPFPAGGDTPLAAFEAGKKKGLTTEGTLESLFGKGSDFASQSGEFQANLRKTQVTVPKAQSSVPKAQSSVPKAQSSVPGVVSFPAPKPPKLTAQKVAAPKKRVTTGRRRAFGGNRKSLASLRSRSLRERNS